MTHQNSIPFFANKILPKKQMLQRCLQRYFKSPFSSISHKKASILARVDIEPVFLVLRVWLLLKFYDCLVFSQIINSYPLVAVFWIFGGSKNLDSMFLFQPVSLGAVSCHCQQKKWGVLLLALLQGHFLPLFFRRNTLSCVTPKEKWNMLVILFRIACYTHKIQNCPPKDIF